MVFSCKSGYPQHHTRNLVALSVVVLVTKCQVKHIIRPYKVYLCIALHIHDPMKYYTFSIKKYLVALASPSGKILRYSVLKKFNCLLRLQESNEISAHIRPTGFDNGFKHYLCTKTQSTDWLISIQPIRYVLSNII